MGSQKRLGRRLEEVTKAAGGLSQVPFAGTCGQGDRGHRLHGMSFWPHVSHEGGLAGSPGHNWGKCLIWGHMAPQDSRVLGFISNADAELGEPITPPLGPCAREMKAYSSRLTRSPALHPYGVLQRGGEARVSAARECTIASSA